jgi:hypothetical protein
MALLVAMRVRAEAQILHGCGSMVGHNSQNGVQWLAVGSLLHLQPDIPDCKDRYPVVVHGWDEGKFILADMPSVEDAAEVFKVGTDWVARYVLSGKAFGFKMELIKTLVTPKPLVFFRYPDKIETFSIRKHKRISTFMVGSLSRRSGEAEALDEIECVIRDLSRGGCLIETNANLSVGDNVTLSFVLPNGERLQSIPAEVRNARSSSEEIFEGGVMFREDADEKRVLDSFFERIRDAEC